ncbi:DUF4306 domain-containing protein [Bacillus solitudinis]|uniref:DUF4306 domain-containing protein n=1 Tax=Bacillus solitudinis TaxID=2014074 RepID=UPI000C24438C|nr:DUF4306 domain-containing protein [Bacillus solitudinis]
MKKWWIMWLICIPIFLVSYVYSIFITSKIAYLPQSECKPKFIFTPQDVQYCSEIYPIDVILIAFKTNPITYIWLLTGLYIIGFLVFVLITKIRKRKLF